MFTLSDVRVCVERPRLQFLHGKWTNCSDTPLNQLIINANLLDYLPE